MSNLAPPKTTLRTLILLFTLASVLVTLLNSLIVAYQVYREILIGNTLTANQAYAQKIAMSIHQTLDEDVSKLRYSAQWLATRPNDIPEEIKRLLEQDDNFNSILVADTEGKVTAALPEKPGLIGKKLITWSPQLNAAPKISSAFTSLSGNLVVFISHPLTTPDGQAVGVIGGTIYLTSDNPLVDILGNHGFRNGTYVYLVDGEGTYLFHPDRSLLGLRARNNEAVTALLRGESGAITTRDATGHEVLAGYAPIPGTHWGVVTQQPLQTADDMVDELINAMAWRMLPIVLFGLCLIGLGATRISQPLQQLADGARQLSEASSTGTIKQVKAWYVEAWRIRRALLIGIGLLQDKIGTLNEQAHHDPLTGLANRRAMDQALSRYVSEGTFFAVIAADIDHFKNVNDTFGHDVGDLVLRRIAELLSSHSRPVDVVCRAGGEEFLILLPGTSLMAATAIAERIRLAVQNCELEQVGPVTISLGVTYWHESAGIAAAEVLKRADELLYQAKQAGRNRVIAETGLLLSPP